MVSFIIPLFNVESLIRRCVESVRIQTIQDIEIILVDDGSTDASLSICNDLADKEPRIVVFHQENSGASVARNKGLDVARGDWIMFVDSDDWIEPNMLERMIAVANDHPEVQVVQTRVPQDMKNQKENRLFSGSDAVRCLLEGSWWGPCCKLVSRTAIGRDRFPQQTISEDFLFNYHLFSKIDNLYYIDECFYHRENRQGSLSKISLSERKFDELYNVKAVFDAVSKDYPQFLSLAEVHMAGTCMKLLSLTLSENQEKTYGSHLEVIFSFIRRHYMSLLRNRRIPFFERLLLAGCRNEKSARHTYRLYYHAKGISK